MAGLSNFLRVKITLEARGALTPSACIYSIHFSLPHNRPAQFLDPPQLIASAAIQWSIRWWCCATFGVIPRSGCCRLFYAMIVKPG
jgi:hypothetical protein